MGTIRLAEYGEVSNEELASREVVQEWEFLGNRRHMILRVGQGWESAGAVLRWTDGYIVVHSIGRDGSIGGRHVPSVDEGRTLIERWRSQ